MNVLEKFSQRHVVFFSIVVTLSALMIWSIEWDSDPFMGFDMLLSHTMTCLLAV